MLRSETGRWRAARRRSLLSLVLVVAVGCGGGDGASGNGEAERLRSASQALCDAVDLAAGGDIEGAEATFLDRVHGFLHEFADRLTATSRRATAELLEAKQRVEAVLADPAAGGTEVGEALTALHDELDDAAEVAGLSLGPCAEGG